MWELVKEITSNLLNNSYHEKKKNKTKQHNTTAIKIES